ncbi:ring-cleaving dioxygenase [Flavilitoribacter nigricans]|uniref:Glyoxalase n=1 Tax=Flavilitoribacter nigricans (strain ATCC 23147 / DSM 23189 / NBRC 102662 / NCIMB 1420 / SS-2) TaxID=1122177 RepID=A0A2D0N3S1_FLAN2|nr:ring-cleaving dioxygenase [Flavilitoribacter nigricans]PHN03192.1 glyoxalase [Flavilitoribacter nigricans DSM 23189 = NBRC 102662]
MDIKGLIKGIHHVTATVNDAQEDYDFYTKTLGLRLVKETVNFDNEKVYHFYYGNEIGSPSTIFTTFPYKGQGVRQGTIGSGQVYQTSFSIPEGTLSFWKKRLQDHGVTATETQRFGQPVLEFEDPSGLRLDLMEAGADDREPLWAYREVSKAQAIRGMHNVTLLIQDAPTTIRFLEIFGYRTVQTDGELTLLESGTGGPGNSLIVRAAPAAEPGINGIGTVHHVAHRVAQLEDSMKIKEKMEKEFGLKVTRVMDRKYFQSIYFRIPGGVLFEVATEGPGFMVDESREELGTALKLPAWQEPNRDRIEANLLKYIRN